MATQIELSENAKNLETHVRQMCVSKGRLATEVEIELFATQLRQVPFLSVSDDEFKQVILNLHESLQISMGLGSFVKSENHKPWLNDRKKDITPYFWDRYKQYLISEGMSPKVVSLSLDKVTDDILDLCGDPQSKDEWSFRGLVMGDVQSGKTSNYSGLICKAADSGYKLIILLTGTLESLRRQTQERLDLGFVGFDSSKKLVKKNKERKEIGVGLIDGTREAGIFTSTIQDFNTTTANNLGIRLSNHKEPILIVVKKHKKILENLSSWLVTMNGDQKGLIHSPLLLIDDEADNASVSTDPVKATAINGAIRSLLKKFPRSSYVGFTATPFANIFIHPDTTHEMEGDDLFPRDFVYALDAPSNYIGAKKMFGIGSNFEMLREFEAYDDSDLPKSSTVGYEEVHKDKRFYRGLRAEDIFPFRHRSTLLIDGLPDSMLEAIGCFIVANAVMDNRANVSKHRSMLINVSHYTDVQNQIRDEIKQVLDQMQQDVRNFASLEDADSLKNVTMKILFDIYNKEYSNSGVSWKEIKNKLTDSVLPISVRAINRDSGAASLDYKQYKETGLRVIAVGGNSLARGLTLEGLIVSYFYRSTQMYDALLQMGRWFGYRSNYDDLIRVWMTEEAQNWYSHITEASEELRESMKEMQKSRMRPKDFGLKVRSHPDSLLITARNKMRTGTEVVRMISMSMEGPETSRLLNNNNLLRANFSATQDLILKLVNIENARDLDNINPLWKNIDSKLLIDFFKQFVSHPLSLQLKDLAEFIANVDDPILKKWDVVVPQGREKSISTIKGLGNFKPQLRKITVHPEQKLIQINGTSMRVGSQGVEKEGLDKDKQIMAKEYFHSLDENNKTKPNVPDKYYRQYRDRPLLILHILTPRPTGLNKDEFSLNTSIPLVAVGLSFPKLKTGSSEIRYMINLVELRSVMPVEDNDGDDEDSEDTEDV